MQASLGTNDILFIGLNPANIDEAKSLRAKGCKVYYIGQGKSSDCITLNNHKYNLRIKTEINAFTRSFGLPESKSAALAVAIDAAPYEILDEFAQLIIVLNDIENKKSGPDRLVISAHSSVGEFWGDDNGRFHIRNLKAIFSVFPFASSKIEDLHLSACYTGGVRDFNQWKEIFPKISTIWAYTGSAPGTYSGAKKHLSLWATATRGSKIRLDRGIANNTRKGHNVTVWSKFFGYKSKNSSDFGDLIARINVAESTYQKYFNGTINVQNTQSGPLRDYYSDLHDLIDHEMCTATQREKFKVRAKSTIRLIYFDKSIKKKFVQIHESDLRAGYGALGLKYVDFSKLSRKACIDEINNFELSANKKPSPEINKLKTLLLDGLKNLDEAHIPPTWI